MQNCTQNDRGVLEDKGDEWIDRAVNSSKIEEQDVRDEEEAGDRWWVK